MLKITIPGGDYYDSKENRFYTVKEQTIALEHSLVSISKWESKWHKPFLTDERKTVDETRSYIQCMTLTQNVDPKVYNMLTNDNVQQVNAYVEDSMTASWVNDTPGSSRSRETVTSELIYYWMIALNIPFECQKWHLNRLLMLIRICNAKNQQPKKMSKSEIMRRNSQLNAARRKAMHTKG